MTSAPTTSTLWIPERLAVELLAWAEEWRPLEVGGVLAGYWNGESAVVTDIVGPGPNARHSRTRFLPDHAFHETRIDEIYDASEGASVYLGDWHTHPEGPPALSYLDKRTLRSVGNDADAHCPMPIMVLAAWSSGSWTLQSFTLAPARWRLPRKVMDMRLKVF